MSDSRKEEILSRNLDREQLKAASGGEIHCIESHHCSRTARRDDCHSDVAYLSWCGRNDACLIWSNKYGNCSTDLVDLNN